MCLHCEEPACASACLVGALKKSALGPVTYDNKKCMGCRYCMIACPQGVPKYQWSKLAPYVQKCDMCFARISTGGKPACVEACPVEASVFGNREALLNEAWSRIRNDSSLRAADLRSGGVRRNVSALPDRCAIRKTRLCETAHWKPAFADAFGGGIERESDGGAGGRVDALRTVLDYATPQTGGAGRSRGRAARLGERETLVMSG